MAKVLRTAAVLVALTTALAGAQLAEAKGKRGGKGRVGVSVTVSGLPTLPVQDASAASVGAAGSQLPTMPAATGGTASPAGPSEPTAVTAFIGPPADAAPGATPPPAPPETAPAAAATATLPPPPMPAGTATLPPPPSQERPATQAPPAAPPVFTPAPIAPPVLVEQPAPGYNRPRQRIMDYPTTFLTYTGGALMLAGVAGFLTSGALQATDGTPGGSCSYYGQTLTGSDCATNYTSLFQIGYGVSAGMLAVGGALLAGGIFRYYRRQPKWTTQ